MFLIPSASPGRLRERLREWALLMLGEANVLPRLLWAAVILFLMCGPNVKAMTVVVEGVGAWAPTARILHDSSILLNTPNVPGFDLFF